MAELETPASDGADDGDIGSFKQWFKDDREHATAWREEAKIAYAFTAGDQWTDEERKTLEAQGRPCITFNRIAPIIDSVSGSEVNNRQEVAYIPREQGDVKVNEVITEAAKWFRDQCHAEDEDSDAFRDTLICGMGWTDTRLDFEEDPDGQPEVERIDPFEMFWDHNARQSNLLDARRLWRVRKMPLSEAQRMFPEAEAEDLDATWADDGGDDDEASPKDADPPHYLRSQVGDDDDASDRMVTIVHCQWKELESFYRAVVTNPQTGEKQSFDDLSPDQRKQVKERIGAVGWTYKEVKQHRFVFRQAFFGRTRLEEPPAARKGFTWVCITGRRDRNKGTWFGLVRAMKDPQEYANKWLSQALHILNSQAKGGIVAEVTAFQDVKQAEESWAAGDRITWLKQGGMEKWGAKPVAQFPAGFMQLMEYANSSVRDASGVNLETLGMRDANQPGILENMRKQSSMTILANLFDSLRRYRKIQGEILLDYIQNDLSDGRLVRIVGQDGEKYVPLVKDPAAGDKKYDIVIDESPSAPNQKEQVFGIISQMLPTIGDKLTPDMWATVMEYSPLPSSFVEKLKAGIEAQKQQAGQPTPEMQAKQLDVESKKIDLEAKTQQNEQAQSLAQIEAGVKAKELEVRSKELDVRQMEAAAKAQEVEANRQVSIVQHTGMLPPPAQSDVAPAVEQIVGALGQRLDDHHARLHEVLTAPTEIIRDPVSGKPVGTRKVMAARA